MVLSSSYLRPPACWWGDGNSIRIWEDPWVPELHEFIPSPKNGVDPNGIILVSQLFNSTLSGWDVHKLNWWFKNSKEIGRAHV